jgi:hypothetical protein
MSFPKLIMCLVLGSSSVALARPASVYDHRDDDSYSQPSYDRDFDGDRGNQWQRFRFRPITFASNVSLMRQWNRDQRPMLIDIDQRIGGLRRIRLQHNDGRMYVDSVVVMFADGRRQTIPLNQMLSSRQPSIQLDLERGAVTALSVNGSTMRGRATFDVIGLRR